MGFLVGKAYGVLGERKREAIEVVNILDTRVVAAEAGEMATVSAKPIPSPVIPTATPTPTTTPPQAKAVATTAPVQSNSPSSALWTSINTYRQNHGVSTLSHDGELCSFSGKRLSELMNSGNLNHNGFAELLNEYVSQKHYAKIGETLAQSYTDPDEIVRRWDESEPHRAIIQDAAYTRGCESQGNGFTVLIVGKK